MDSRDFRAIKGKLLSHAEKRLKGKRDRDGDMPADEPDSDADDSTPLARAAARRARKE
jgi:hypothetical protein